MPYSFETKHKLLPEKFDRRCKLTSIQKAEIVEKYKTGFHSLNSLAKEYGVSKSLILLTVNPSSKAKNDQRIKDNWMKYQPTKEERNRVATEHRHYKHSLDIQGLLK